MTAPALEERANPFEDFATPIAPPLPTAFRAELNDFFDEPVYWQGEVREIFQDSDALLPGDYLLGEGDDPCWLRVDETKQGLTGSAVRLTDGLTLFVPAGRSVWIWRAADVLAWMALGESAGAR